MGELSRSRKCTTIVHVQRRFESHRLQLGDSNWSNCIAGCHSTVSNFKLAKNLLLRELLLFFINGRHQSKVQWIRRGFGRHDKSFVCLQFFQEKTDKRLPLGQLTRRISCSMLWPIRHTHSLSHGAHHYHEAHRRRRRWCCCCCCELGWLTSDQRALGAGAGSLGSRWLSRARWGRFLFCSRALTLKSSSTTRSSATTTTTKVT